MSVQEIAMRGGVNLLEAWEAFQADIARGVNRAVGRYELEDQASIALATQVKFRENGSLTLYQLGDTVTLTAGQVEELMARIKAGVS